MSVSSAIRALRDAPNNQKQPSLEALRTLSCQHPRACEAQHVCAGAYTLHQGALETSALLRERLRRPDAPVDGAAELLALAEKDLERARVMMKECLRLETAMLIEAR